MEAGGVVGLVMCLGHAEPASGGRLSLLWMNTPTDMIHHEYCTMRILIKNPGEKKAKKKAEVLHSQDYKTHQT